MGRSAKEASAVVRAEGIGAARRGRTRLSFKARRKPPVTVGRRRGQVTRAYLVAGVRTTSASGAACNEASRRSSGASS